MQMREFLFIIRFQYNVGKRLWPRFELRRETVELLGHVSSKIRVPLICVMCNLRANFRQEKEMRSCNVSETKLLCTVELYFVAVKNPQSCVDLDAGCTVAIS